MKLTWHSEVRTRHSARPVRLSGVFVDAAGSVKGLTVLRVLPAAMPSVAWTSELANFPLPVFCGESEIGILDPFWWQSREVATADEEATVSWTGGAMTCLFTLAEGVKPDEERWLKGRARIAAAETYIDKPVRLAGGGEIGVIVDEMNHLSLSGRSIYPLLRLRRNQADRASDVSVRNGAMVFAQENVMIGIIVATFGDGEFYSVAPIEDIMEWHALSFIPIPPLEKAQTTTSSEGIERTKRSAAGSEEIVKLIGN